MQVKRRRGDDSGPKVKRARLVHENAMREDDGDSDDDDSVHDFRRVQIIHKQKVKQRTTLQDILKKQNGTGFPIKEKYIHTTLSSIHILTYS
jgi:hypothetical protein